MSLLPENWHMREAIIPQLSNDLSDFDKEALQILRQYRTLKSSRAKLVVWLKDENGKQFREIGEIAGFSHETARRIYLQAKEQEREAQHGR